MSKTNLIFYTSLVASIVGFWVLFFLYPSLQIPQLVLKICFSFCCTIVPLYIIVLVLAVYHAMKDIENENEPHEDLKKNIQQVKIYGSK